MNTLDKLTQLQGAPASPARPRAESTRRIPAAALPLGLLLAFVAVFALMFGARLLPAAEVRIAPVITLRSAQQPGPSEEAEAPAASIPDADFQIPKSQSLLFQASGWVEPDPYITQVSTLINGVLNEVHVLEGEGVKKGQLLATLIDEDAKLDLEEAKRKIDTLNAKQTAHCAELPVLNAQMHATDKNIAAEEAFLAELRDVSERLDAAKKGSVSERDVIVARLKVQRQVAALDEAKAELPRLLAMINKVDLERLTVDGQIKEAETDLARKQLALDRTRIHSTMDGIVLRLHAAPGKKRMLNMDDPTSAVIVELYDPNKLQARIDVPLTEAAGLSVGQPVKLSTDLLPDAKFNGIVTRLVGEADLQRNTLQAKVRILNPDPRLRPEMLVRAEFYPGAARPSSPSSSPGAQSSNPQRLSLFAAREALLNQRGSTGQAWIVADNRAELRDLTLGTEERDQHLLVTAGLRPGDKLILPPHEKLKEGKRVKVIRN